jgi:hypothetical protein
VAEAGRLTEPRWRDSRGASAKGLAVSPDSLHEEATRPAIRGIFVRRFPSIMLISAAVLAAAPAWAKPSIYLSPMGEPFRTNEAGEAPFDQWFGLADQDGDGAISLVEFRADAESFFATLDGNGDKLIDADEMSRYELLAPGRTRAAGGLVPPASSSRPTPTSSAPVEKGQVPIVSGPTAPSNTRIHPGGSREINFSEVPQPVAMADLNLDRRVTIDEFLKTAGRRFSARDLDKNGKLDRRELR